MHDKRGLELAITTVIMIILSISVLAVLVLFFNSQTGFLSQFLGSQTPESNVDAVISSCTTLATSGSTYAYCCEEKEVIFSEESDANGAYTCFNASQTTWGTDIPELSCDENLCQ